MKVLASPRMRRRLRWVGLLMVFAVGVAGLIVLLPGKHQKETPLVVSHTPLPEAPPAPVTRTNRELVPALQVAAQFIQTAVARKNVGKSWDLISPTYEGKSEYTRKEWAKGDRALNGEGIPVVEYPVDRARWKRDYSLKDEVGFKVALFPPKGNTMPATVFDVAVHAYGKGTHRRWLVDYWSPSGGRTITTSQPKTVAGLPNLNPLNENKSRLGKAWIIVPILILFMIVLAPLALGIGHVVRVKRAERDFAGGKTP